MVDAAASSAVDQGSGGLIRDGFRAALAQLVEELTGVPTLKHDDGKTCQALRCTQPGTYKCKSSVRRNGRAAYCDKRYCAQHTTMIDPYDDKFTVGECHKLFEEARAGLKGSRRA
jgi:hypothetical protein